MGHRKSHCVITNFLFTWTNLSLLPLHAAKWFLGHLPRGFVNSWQAATFRSFAVTSAPSTMPQTQKLHDKCLLLKNDHATHLTKHESRSSTNYLELCVSFHCTERAQYTKALWGFCFSEKLVSQTSKVDCNEIWYRPQHQLVQPRAKSLDQSEPQFLHWLFN